MTTPRFRIHKFIKGKYTFFGIHVPGYMNATGKSGYYYFRTKSEAERGRVELLNTLTSSKRLSLLSNAQQDDALRAINFLVENNIDISLFDLAQKALPLLSSSGLNMPLSTLFADFATTKAAIWSPVSFRNFKNVTGLLLAAFGDVSVSEITTRSLQNWLSSRFEKPGYRMNTIRTLRPAFNYAVRQGIIPESPFTKLEQIRIKAREEIDIFSPAEARRLMASAPQDCRAAYAVLLFAGVRPAELTRLTWANIREEYIHLTPSITKTAQARNIEIEPTLAAWLSAAGPHADNEPICPANWKRKNQATRAAAGLSNRPDTARHSYATYHLAIHQNTESLKINMGHSRNSDTLFVHYRAAATPATAAEFWNILPENTL